MFEVRSSVVGTSLHSKELSDQTFWGDELERRFIHHNDSFSSQLPQLRDPVLFLKCFLSLFHTHTVLALLLLLLKLNSLPFSFALSPARRGAIDYRPTACSLTRQTRAVSLTPASQRTDSEECAGA